jgi:hypothetical protein
MADPQTMANYFDDPIAVLQRLKVPLSAELTAALRGRSGLERARVPRRFRLSGGHWMTPQIELRIKPPEREPVLGKPDVPHAVLRLFPFDQLFKPSGLETHGYSMVYEITKSRLNEVLAQLFDKGLLNRLLIGLGHPALAGKPFSLTVEMGIPSDVVPTPAASSLSDVIGLCATVEYTALGITTRAVLRWGASLVVDHSDPQFEIFKVDLRNALAYAEARFTVTRPNGSVSSTDLSGALQALLVGMNSFPAFFPLKVSRDGSSTVWPQQVDAKVIDDAGAAGNDALALLFTLPGGSAGDRNAFTQSFVSDGGGLMVDFKWLRGRILPAIETAFGLPANAISRTTGTWSGDAELPETDGARLTFFALGVLPGTDAIAVFVGARKDGDCYSATASTYALARIAVEDGVLKVPAPQIGDPTVSVDIPWYCYLAAIVVGGAFGELVLGSLGNLVGAVLVPVLLHSTEEAIENTINSALSKVTGGITSNFPSVSLDLGALKELITFAHIDDLMLLQDVHVCDSIPAHSAGSRFIPNGGCLSLADGQVNPPTVAGSDIGLAGAGASRFLTTLGTAAIAACGPASPECVTRYSLYGRSYAANQHLPLAQLAPTQIYGVTTAGGYYAWIRVTGIRSDGVWLEYKTYPRDYPAFALDGKFVLAYREPRASATTPAPSQPTFQSKAGIGVGVDAGRWGSWVHGETGYYVADGLFSISQIGLQPALQTVWTVQGQSLATPTGTITIDSVPFDYQCDAQQLSLRMNPPQDTDLTVNVTIAVQVTDAAGQQLSASRTDTARALHQTHGGRQGMVVPELGQYLKAYKIHIGPWLEYDPETAAQVMVQYGRSAQRK